MTDFSNMTIHGYRRDNGRVGVRNHVLILPVDDISNAAVEAVANNVKGTLAIPHAYGRLQFGEDLDVHFRTMIGTGANANVAAVVVIGIEPEWTKIITDGIATTGKPVNVLVPSAHELFPPAFPFAPVLVCAAPPAPTVMVAVEIEVTSINFLTYPPPPPP